MSLDVYLISKVKVPRPASSGIFVRQNGKTVEISEEEWHQRFPDREPVRYIERFADTNELYHDNITHNLGKMAAKADLYLVLWRPEDLEYRKAADLIKPLEDGLAELQSNPDYYKQFNPENGWGDYEQLVQFVADYLEACRQWPDATLEVSI
jgi:predicted ribosome quality control (RQC) complex YloA/Tae2 family protein